MKENFEIVATTRDVQGKGSSRRLRHEGQVPGIIYGGDAEPTMFATNHNDLLLHLEHESFYTHVLTLKLDGKEETVVLKDLQRHPAKPFILHLDLLRVSKKDKIKMTVPFHFVNEETCHGIKMQGGAASHLMNDVEIICAAQDLPEYIEVDMANLEMDQTIHLSEVKLPKGVEIVALTHGEEHDTGVVSIHKPKVQAVEEDAPAAEGDAAEAEGESKED